MEKNYLLLLLLMSCGGISSVAAQDTQTYYVQGRIKDVFTGAKIPAHLKVDVLTPDSSLYCEASFNATTSEFKFEVDGTKNQFLLHVTHPDYVSVYYPISLKFTQKKFFLELGAFDIRKKTLSEKRQDLGEVVVKATKVKFYHKGDTLVYNADAFQLAEGSMLDALIEQLPGVQLKDDGRIFVNGRFVESLLLNGRDFFKEDKDVMLKNLPAYAVKNVKVYAKESELSEMMGRKMDEGSYVMDVHLKKEYDIGWLANTEWAGGIEKRYMGRLFGLRYTPNTRFSFFGNMNNLNSWNSPGKSGEWSMPDFSGGVSDVRNAGVDYDVFKDQGIHTYSASGSVKVDYQKRVTEKSTNQVNFLPEGDTYGRLYQEQLDHGLTVNTYHVFKYGYSNDTELRITLNPSFFYSKRDGRAESLKGLFDTDPEAYRNLRDSLAMPQAGDMLRSMMVNRSQNFSNYLSDYKSGGMSTSINWRPAGRDDLFTLYGRFTMDRSEYESFRHEWYDYNSQNENNDFRNRYTTTLGRNEDYSLSASYYWHINRTLLASPQYNFNRKHSSNDNLIYRLERLDGWQKTDSLPDLGSLPSFTDELRKQLLDNDNSYTSEETSDTHSLGFNMQWNITVGDDEEDNAFWYVQVFPRVRILQNKLDYRGIGTEQMVSRTEWLPDPSVQFRYNTKGKKHEVKFRFNVNGNMPSLFSLLTVRYDSDPLNISTGNPDLRNTYNYNVSADYRADKWLLGTGRMLSANVSYNASSNAVAMQTFYDRETGVRTTMPINVNGNWSSYASLFFLTPLDKDRKFSLSTNTSYYYNNNVDLTSESGDAIKSIVRNKLLSESLSLEYRYQQLRLTARLNLNWRQTDSKRQGFQPINAWDINYCLGGQWNLPFDFQLNSDLVVYTRNGYEEPSMNTKEWVWDARLSKTFFKGALTLMLEGFDMLGQLSTIQTAVNAQGRSESYCNAVPSYGMLHLIYRLDLKPKQR